VNIKKFIAGQLRKPSGLFGRFIMIRLLNLINVSMNGKVIEILHLQPEDHVLEVGFGGGDLISKMSHVVTRGHITGVDFSIDAVEACRKRFDGLIKVGTIELLCANIEALPFDADTFTKVCTVNTIYFWPDPIEALNQIHRVLKREGSLLICFNPREVLEKQNLTQHGFRLFESEEVRDLMTTAGFREVQLVFGQGRGGKYVVAKGLK
jgi:SAM-dependent methyltransferase